MAWLSPSPGVAKSSNGPSWLQPAPNSGTCQRPSASQHLADWLTPAVNSRSSASSVHPAQEPPTRQSQVTKEQPPSWLNPPATSQCSVGGERPSKRRRTIVKEEVPAWLNVSAGSPSSGSRGPAFSPESEAATANPAVRRIHLDLVSLLMIDAKASKKSTYQNNGADVERIRKKMSIACKCGVTAKLKTADVIAFCTHVHSLSDEAVTHYFHTAYDTCDGGHQPTTQTLRTEWYFLGHRINVECLQGLLGMGTRTFYKRCHGTLDMRKFPAPSGHSSPQSLIVDQFFCELYSHAAERLPEVAAPLRNVDEHIARNQQQRSEFEDANEPLVFLNWTPHHQAMDVVSLAVSGKPLPVRHLQHCRLSDLWWQFVAWHSSCEAIEDGFPCPSWTTFWRRWHARWRHVLGFREVAQHSQCAVCFRCSAFLHKGRGTPEEKRQCAEEWRAHLSGQYHDRLIYWHMRWFSRLRTKGVLCIIIDSMDKAKLPFPQYQWRRPKILDRFRRPRMVVTCAWAHGFCCDFYISHDELSFHGASAFCEILTRTIQHVMDICRRDNIQPPEHLVVQSDNTTAQAKNSETGMYLATIVGKKLMLSALLNFLIVGHTHEDIDQLFSVLLALVVRRHRFHTPMELVTETQIAMDKIFADRPEEVSAQLLGEIYDFGTWLDAEGVQLHNAWVSREGVDAPHSFCYKMREDLTAEESQSVLRRRAPHAPQHEDVFCITKRWMHSEQAQAPVLVLPHARLQLLQSPGPVRRKFATEPMSDTRKQELEDLASQLEDMTEDWGTDFSYYRAAEALRDLAQERVPPPAVHHWLWQGHGQRNGPLHRTRNRYFNTMPDMAWSLLARFRRLAPG